MAGGPAEVRGAVYTGTMASICKAPARDPKQASRRRAAVDRLLEPAVFRALSDPVRGRLWSCLLKCARPCSVTEAAACCALDYSVVARHLATLARAGLLTSEKRGRMVFYTARGDALAGRFRALADAIDELVNAGEVGCAPGRGRRR